MVRVEFAWSRNNALLQPFAGPLAAILLLGIVGSAKNWRSYVVCMLL